MDKREIVELVRGQAAVDGAGVKLVRVLGRDNVQNFDPFLMLDSFDSKNSEDYIAGFPFHPHRGIETVTYLIKGEIEHQDSLGNIGVIHDGECQWMTAGSGIMHQEMPRPRKDEHMLGFQLWVNLPQKDKMTEPKYFDISKGAVQEKREDGVVVKVISGNYKGIQGMDTSFVNISLYDIHMEPHQIFMLSTKKEDNVFIFVIEGTVKINGKSIDTKTAVRFGEGDRIEITALEQGARVIYFGGKPLKEEIAWAGPVVMNTEKELRETFQELKDGTFIKHKIKI